MKKIILLSAIFVLSLVLAACQPVVDEKKADFCRNVGDFAQAQVQFRQLNASSSKRDAEEAVSDLQRDFENLVQSGADVKEAQLKEVEDALENLKRDIKDIPDDAENIAEAELMIKQDVLNTVAETVQIMTTNCTYGQEQ